MGFLMLCMALAAIEGTIVATAMPSIVASVGGFEYYAWVFAAFLLAQATSTPLYGRLSDLRGRKPVLLVGIVVFMLGSVLCGFATTMPLLVAFRLLQGFGAGAIYPTVSTLVGDLYEVNERGRAQGYLSSVWGVSAVLGPLLGGALVERAHWAWVFWFNVPFGLAAIVGLWVFLHESVAHSDKRLDLVSAAQMFVAIGAFMLLLTQGPQWGWAVALTLAAVAVAVGVAFVRRQLASETPLLGIDLWRDKLILLADVATFAGGMLMIGLITYSPTYVQGVMGYSPTIAGLALTAMSVGWTLASMVAGRLIVPWGPSTVGRIGGAAAACGGFLYLLLTPARGPWWVAFSSLTVGVGLGVIMTTMVVTIQSSVAWGRRGGATATNMLMRLLGNSLGAAVLGAVLNMALAGSVGENGESVMSQVQALLAPGSAPSGAQVTTGTLALLATSLHAVYVGVFAIGLLTLLLTWLLPRGRQLA